MGFSNFTALLIENEMTEFVYHQRLQQDCIQADRLPRKKD